MPPYNPYPYHQYPNVWRPPPQPPASYGQGQPGFWAPPAPSGWNPGAYMAQPPQEPKLEPKDFRSEKYPQLNPVLAADSTLVRFNVTKKPSQEILTSTYYNYRHAPANKVRVKLMRLVSKHFPWAVDIPAPNPGSGFEKGITCDMVWTAVWECLQQPIADSEWALILQDKKKMEQMMKAHKKRTGSDNIKGDMRIRRCDYLGEEVWFRGLEKDEAFLKARLLPGDKAVADTWMVVLGDK